MDPLTQGVLGAVLPQATVKNKRLALVGLFGVAGGMAPDLDVFIRSETDPLLFLEYHRHFTHSLFFIPFGGLICGLLMHGLIGKRVGFLFWQSILYCTLGYATHALLDTCTTYGTMLLWPFSDQRFAWNTIAVIDPAYTLPLLLLVVLAAIKQRTLFARIAMVWVLVYPSLGAVQRERAEELGWELANERGHKPIRLEAKPTFANLLVWKIVYETDQAYFVDAVRMGVEGKVYSGEYVRKLSIAEDLPWLLPDSQQAKDIERFRWFSNGYLAMDPKVKNRVIDIRYSMLPNQIDPLWWIDLSPAASKDDYVVYGAQRNRDNGQWQLFSAMLLGE